MSTLDDWYVVFWLAGSASLLVVSSAAVYAWCAYRRKQPGASLENGIRAPTRASLAVVTTEECQALLDSAPPSPPAYRFEPSAGYRTQSPTVSISRSVPIQRYGTVTSVTQATSLARDATLGPLPYTHGAIGVQDLAASVLSERQSLVQPADLDPLVHDSAWQSPASGAQALAKHSSPVTSLRTPESSVNHVDFRDLPPNVPSSTSLDDPCPHDATQLVPSEPETHKESLPELLAPAAVAVSPSGSSKTGALSFVASVDSISTISDRTSHRGSPPNLASSCQSAKDGTAGGVSVPETACLSTRTLSSTDSADVCTHRTPVAVSEQLDSSVASAIQTSHQTGNGSPTVSPSKRGEISSQTKPQVPTKVADSPSEDDTRTEDNADTSKVDCASLPEARTPSSPASPPTTSRASRRRANRRKRRNQDPNTSPHPPSSSSSPPPSQSPLPHSPVALNLGTSLPDAGRPFMVKQFTNPRARALTIGDYRDTQWALPRQLNPSTQASKATPGQRTTAPTRPPTHKVKPRQRSQTLPLTYLPDAPIDVNVSKIVGTRELTVYTNFYTLETEREKVAYTELLIESCHKTLDRQAKKANKEPAKRTSKRCKFWPTCNSSSCKYRHPNRKCKNCLNCRRPNCMFIHYSDVPDMYKRLCDKMVRQSNHYSRLGKIQQPKSKSLDLPRS
ncbi:hypothetical protein H4R35_002575 [Dimargaris xerosporica]|nr:hypothetical protein H4R35_002575 [Dimargaris xerosporica]